MAYKDFQQTVGQTPALGVPGQEVTVNQAVYTPFQFTSDGTVQAGTFAFTDGSPVAGKNVAYLKKAGGKLVGFVPKNTVATFNSPFASNSNVYPAGQPLSIAIRGQFYFEIPASGNASEGQSVLCNPTNGQVTFGDAGAANDTGWIVHLTQGATTATAGDIVIIENWGVSVTAGSP